ncbi:MAG: hypothetical protein N2483_02690 [Burkholderiaceae bacterium]|nr:hypothetical protein [Burkholderiaceae bacterium]
MKRLTYGAQRQAQGNVKALDPYRATYAALKKRYDVGRSNVIVTPGYLRSEVVLGASNAINFPILVNEGGSTGAPRSTERRLAISDRFVITDLGIRIGRLSGTGPETTPGPMRLESFVNPAVFTVAAEQAALHTLYNGSLAVKVGSITYIEAIDMLRFIRADTAQRGLNVSATAPSSYGMSYMHGLSDLADIVPTITFDGQQKNVVTVTLPEAANMAAAAPATNVAVFIAKGFLCQNAANYKA